MKLYLSVAPQYSRYDILRDFCELLGMTIANAMRFSDKREQSYLKTASRYNKNELNVFAEMFAILVLALDKNPKQDFLGTIYMEMGFAGSNQGVSFTPYHLAELMAGIAIQDTQEQLETEEYISVADDSCGSGVTLIAAANHLYGQGVNYQERVLFVAQDINFTFAMMCYIQMSLLGLPGYVTVGNTLTEPHTGDPLFAAPDAFCTPLFYLKKWDERRKTKHIIRLIKSIAS